MTKTLGLITLLVMVGPSAQAETTFWPQTTWHSFMASMALRDPQGKHFDEAFRHSLKALENDPMKPELHLNLGVALEGLGSVQKAVESYGVAEKLTHDPALRFQALFNKAQALAKLKKIDEALDQYQKALEIDPESKEVKTNIELLMSGGGKGGEGDEKDQEKDGEGKGDKQQEQPQKFAENKPQERKEPQNLSQADVKKILEELKQQEQRIRGDYYRQGQQDKKQKTGEGKREKDW